MGFFHATKDRLIEKTAPAVLNESLLRDYGKITSFELDSEEKIIRFEAVLFGEKSPISVEILSYEIKEVDGRACFIARKIRTSRAWITTLSENQLIGRPIPLPQQLSGLLARLL